MIRLASDWGEVLMAAARGSLNADRLEWSPEPATCVVVASGGYPGAFKSGEKISGIEEAEGVEGAVVFQAGTKREGEDLVTAGGRVLGVTASGKDLESSMKAAYAAVDEIHFAGMHYRKDIGNRGLRRYNRA
jgi:phosphoribosylamine--glycine ligase